MNDSTVLLAALGIVSACVGGLIWVIKHMFEQVVPALDKVVDSMMANTTATKAADAYLRERNGRDNQVHKDLIKSINAIPEQIIKTADITSKVLKDSVSDQHIVNQTVDTQNVNKVVADKK